MSQCSKDRGLTVISKYLLILLTGLFFLLISNQGFSQDSTRHRPGPPPPPPPHPKLKEMVSKLKNLNPFKKHKDDAPTNENAQASVKDEPKKQDLPPPPPPPDPVKPKATPTTSTNTSTGTSTTAGTTHKTSTKKKTKSTKPATDSKGKVTAPVI